MKKYKALPYVLGTVVALLVLALELYLFCPAINIHNFGLWLIVDFAFLVFLFVTRAARGCKDFGIETVTKQKGPKGKTVKTKKLYFHIHHYLASIGVAALALFILFISRSANFVGIIASSFLMKKGPSNPFMTLIGVFAGIALISIGLIFSSAAIALIGLIQSQIGRASCRERV